MDLFCSSSSSSFLSILSFHLSYTHTCIQTYSRRMMDSLTYTLHRYTLTYRADKFKTLSVVQHFSFSGSFLLCSSYESETQSQAFGNFLYSSLVFSLAFCCLYRRVYVYSLVLHVFVTSRPIETGNYIH